MTKYSTTLILDPEMKLNNGSTLICQCGWKGTISNSTTLRKPNKRGLLVRQLVCCTRCFDQDDNLVILIEDTFNPGLSIVEQANGEADRAAE